MDDSFKVRVDKIFGSLAPSLSSSSQSSWTLSDEEVERREWNRERASSDREENPCFSSFDGFFANNKQNLSKNKSRNLHKDLSDDDDEDGDDEQGRGSSRQSFNRDGDEKDEWEIRSSIGLDCTLDNEEEEDEYDKVALGRENAGERTYMRDVTDYGPYLNSHNVIPDSFQDHARDPRANYLAAVVRLKEDEAGSFDSFAATVNAVPAVVDAQVSEDGGNLRSILKRKESQTDTKSKKRVRFDPGCIDHFDEEFEKVQDSMMVTSSTGTATVSEDASLLPRYEPGVPDYIRNPSKYRRYSFDSSSEVDEESNQQAYMNFLNMIKMSDNVEPQLEVTSTDLPKSVTFIPKKKAGDAMAMKNSSEMKQDQEDASKESISMASFPMGIAAGEVRENEACAMEEDESERTTVDKSVSSRKPGRQYRLKVRSDDSAS